MAKYDVPAIYKQVDPCPHCGAPRVGIDEDDFYRVVPGVLTGHCTCTVCNDRYTLPRYKALFAPSSQDTICPDCGHTVHIRVWTRFETGEIVVSRYCDDRIRLEEREGCPKCKDFAQWPV